MMQCIFLYIDPGTGAMLFSVLMGIVSVLFFAAKGAWVKLKFIFSRGKTNAIPDNRIALVIFSDSKRYWNVFKPICDELERRGFKSEYWTASPDDPALSEQYEHVTTRFIGEGNKAFATLNLMRADICLSTTPGLDVYQWKRSPEVKNYTHIAHSISELVLYRMFGVDFYDTLLFSGSILSKGQKEIEEKRKIKSKEMVTVGSVHFDAMLKRYNTSEKEQPRSYKTILFAPTWGESSALNRFGEKLIHALTNTGYKIVIRPHPQSFTSDPELMDSLIKKFPNSENLVWNTDNDNFEILKKSDILISDFSSVVLDYSFIFNKPVILINPNIDLSPYDAIWLDEPTWLFSVFSQIGTELNEADIHNIKEIIDNTMDNPRYIQGIEKARNESWEYRGEAAKRTVDFLINKYNEISEESVC